MITVIADGRPVERVAHELTTAEAAIVAEALGALGIHVTVTEPDFFGVVHLWAQQPTTTRGEVRALAAFAAVSDSPLAWHGAVASC